MKSETFHYILKSKMFMIGGVCVLFVILVALLAAQIAPFSISESNIANTLAPPSSANWFGTDQYGRDIFSRIVFGSRIALSVGIVCVTIETVLGVVLGVLAGYFGGVFDRVVSFITDLTWSIPTFIMALAIVTALGPSLMNVVISLSVINWAKFTRIVRIKTMAIKNLSYVEAARIYGESHLSIMLRYILPNVRGSIIVIASLSVPEAILFTTSLGFLGLGAQPPQPDWGLILSEGISYLKIAPWISLVPGVALLFTVLGFNLMGEGIRDILDPDLHV